jgi:hypothetical protein
MRRREISEKNNDEIYLPTASYFSNLYIFSVEGFDVNASVCKIRIHQTFFWVSFDV